MGLTLAYDKSTDKKAAAAAAEHLLNQISAALLEASSNEEELPNYAIEVDGLTNNELLNLQVALKSNKSSFNDVFATLPEKTKKNNPVLGELAARLDGDGYSLSELSAHISLQPERVTAAATVEEELRTNIIADLIKTHEKNKVETITLEANDDPQPSLIKKCDSTTFNPITDLESKRQDLKSKLMKGEILSFITPALRKAIMSDDDEIQVKPNNEIMSEPSLDSHFSAKVDDVAEFLNQQTVSGQANTQSGDNEAIEVSPRVWLEKIHIDTAVAAFVRKNKCKLVPIITKTNELGKNQSFIELHKSRGLSTHSQVAILGVKDGTPLIQDGTATLYCTTLANHGDEPFKALEAAKKFITENKLTDVNKFEIHCSYNPSKKHWQQAKLTVDVNKKEITGVRAECHDPYGGTEAGCDTFSDYVTSGKYERQTFAEALKQLFPTDARVECKNLKDSEKRQKDWYNCGPHTIEMLCGAIAETHNIKLNKTTDGPKLRIKHAGWVKDQLDKSIFQEYMCEIKRTVTKNDKQEVKESRQEFNKAWAKSLLQTAQNLLYKIINEDTDGDNKNLTALLNALKNETGDIKLNGIFKKNLEKDDPHVKKVKTGLTLKELTEDGKHLRDMLRRMLCQEVHSPEKTIGGAQAKKMQYEPITDVQAMRERLLGDTELKEFLALKNYPDEIKIRIKHEILNLSTHHFVVKANDGKETELTKQGNTYTVLNDDDDDHSKDKKLLIQDYKHLILSMITYDLYEHQKKNKDQTPLPDMHLNYAIDKDHQNLYYAQEIHQAIKQTVKDFAGKNHVTISINTNKTPSMSNQNSFWKNEEAKKELENTAQVFNSRRTIKEALNKLAEGTAPQKEKKVTIDEKEFALSRDGESLNFTYESGKEGKITDVFKEDNGKFTQSLDTKKVLEEIKKIIADESNSEKKTNSI
jgi:hypothetical protein